MMNQQFDPNALFTAALRDPKLLEELKGALGMAPTVHPDTPITPDQRAQAFTRVVQHGVQLPPKAAPTSWPSYRFHPVHGKRLFANAAEVQRAGAGWVDSRSLLPAPVEPEMEPVAEPVFRRKPGRPAKVQEPVTA